MSQTHLQFREQVNQGSYYTPPEIVELAWQMIRPTLDTDTVIVDTACGYGDFLKNHPQAIAQAIGCDIDSTAIAVARESNANARFFESNALDNVSRDKFGIPSESPLIAVGNPPYNDRTSFIRRGIKGETFKIDADLASRDLGTSFLRAYDKLRADRVCVLHPLSYLIKPTNFRALKGFAANYKLINGLLISSTTFKESEKLTPFPIVIAFYQRDAFGMTHDAIQSFRFNVHGGGSFCYNDFDYITNYIRKYPHKGDTETEDSLFFWTLRDINALRRNRTFVPNRSRNTICIDKRKLADYVYVDVFKRNLHRLPFYFGNSDVMIDRALFQRFKTYFISSAIHHHAFLKEHFPVQPLEQEAAESGIDTYFRELLGEHHT